MPEAVSLGILAKISKGFNIRKSEGMGPIQNRKLKLVVVFFEGLLTGRGVSGRVSG